jgi:hypothetical protein
VNNRDEIANGALGEFPAFLGRRKAGIGFHADQEFQDNTCASVFALNLRVKPGHSAELPPGDYIARITVEQAGRASQEVTTFRVNP